ncbi:MAG TPA: LON peptidase substrate-binding domain-containing protein [Acetobacteraceae bacterium]|nr:LON peptidase substrate-binding domain-containing protein [Acetobacteraceae bacterium]
MGWTNPVPEDLPAAFPVFPLTGALLLPRGKLPLNIFEPRYLAMTEDALAAGRMFGMIQPDSHLPPVPHGPALFHVGCLGRISSFSETEDGRFLITLTGVARFAVREELPGQRGYRRVAGDFTPYLADLDPPPAEPAVERAELLAAVRVFFRQQGIEVNWDAIEQIPDHMLVVTLCMVCPLDPAEKQALLEALTPGERAADLLALLRMAVHRPSVPRHPS